MFKSKKMKSILCASAALAVACAVYLNVNLTERSNERLPANAENDPAVLKDYGDYQLTVLNSFEEAKMLFDGLNREFRVTSICANRAHVWAYDMLRSNHGIRSGKVFIHFTPSGVADEDITWAYHVAPYVVVREKAIVNGVETYVNKEYVLDAGFGAIRGPISIEKWSKYFGKSEKCVVLDPQNNPEHLKLEENNSPGLHPNNHYVNGARQYPVPAGSTCYIRKTPMYYWTPAGVYGNDLAASGRSEYSYYTQTDFNEGQLVQACRQGIQGSLLFKKKWCRKYLGFDE